MRYDYYMAQALEQAGLAFEIEETPIGCVIVRGEAVIGRGYNRRHTDKNALAHAELIAINEACAAMGDWRLEECTLFVTIEPCPMCAGAIVQARVPTVVFGAKNPKAGCAGSIYNLLDEPLFNHRANIVEGVLEEECKRLMKDFFAKIRNSPIMGD